MLSAQDEFDKLCVFYLDVSEIQTSKTDRSRPVKLFQPIKMVFSLLKNPLQIISKLKSLMSILENGGLNHISKLDYQSEIFNYLSKYSKQQLAVLQKLSELNLRSQNGWLSELPVLKITGVFSTLAALFYIVYRTVKETLVAVYINDSYVSIAHSFANNELFILILRFLAFQLLVVIILAVLATLLRLRRVYQARHIKDLVDVYLASIEYSVDDNDSDPRHTHKQ